MMWAAIGFLSFLVAALSAVIWVKALEEREDYKRYHDAMKRLADHNRELRKELARLKRDEL